MGIRDTETVFNFQEKLKNSRKVLIIGNGGIATELVYEIENCDIVWAIKDERLEEKRYENKLNADLVTMLRAEPGDEKDHNGKNFVPEVVKETWLTLGPLRL